MHKQILIATTNSIEGASVERYIELISVNVVIGTNFFSDLGASFTDLFGGLSGNYQKRLEGIYKNGTEKLKRKAMSIGANAILGVKIDFDEISGKGKSMFMLSIIGTAVRLKHKEYNPHNSNINKSNAVSSDNLEQEITKRLIKNKLTNNTLPSEKDWSYLLNFPIREITEKLLDLYLVVTSGTSNDYYENQGLIISNFTNYLALQEKAPLEDLLYRRLDAHESTVMKLLNTIQLFSPEKIIDLIKTGKLSKAINCLQIHKNSYSYDDLKLMQEIIKLFNNLPNLGSLETVKSVLGKEKEKYICPKGHKNDINVTYCTHVGNSECGLNIKGLTRKQVSKISLFNVKVESLDSIFNPN